MENRKSKKTKKLFIIILSVILVFIVMLMVMYGIDINRMRNNKPVVVSTWGYSYVPPIDIKEEKEIELAIMNYLIERGDSEQKNHESQKTFASMRVYLIEKRNKHYNIYAWVVAGKYYLKNDRIKKDSGSSIPYKFVVKNIDGKFTVTDSRIPRDGSFYLVDMENIFPSSVRKDMDDDHTEGTIDRLLLDIEQQTELYFYK